ncbi:MAG: hypothetical protein GWO04_16125, partial [Actinobacteria bacterium]|nr:hypothetical protein [Actinomycetota bacterium]
MEEWDAENKTFSVVMGAGGDYGNIVVSGEYHRQEEMLQAERDWAIFALDAVLNPA